MTLPPTRMSTAAAIVRQLREASAAYYNGGRPLMDDDSYDALVERLRELDPTNSYLTEVGAAPSEGGVALPFKMPSLDKIKPGEDRLVRWLAGDRGAGFVLSEKLDGLSALWIPGKGALYLRGDGVTGQEISHLVRLGVQGLKRPQHLGPVAVRGELLLPRGAGEALARSWVNGIVHRKDPAAADVAKIHFVAYELLEPANLTRQAQLVWLEKNGFEIPWSRRLTSVDSPELGITLQERREASDYDTDGIVVGYNVVPRSESTATKAKNPKDAVAFKMPLAEQAAETTVRAVEWGTSAQGYLIPTLRFDPVQISGATIQLCTGHNAKTVAELSIGPGARVVIRRSGDVIPKLDRVVAAAPGGASLPAGTSWEWDTTRTHIRLVAGAGGESKELVAARLGHFLRSLEVPGCGAATVGALVEGGITGPATLWAAPAERLSELLGPKTGASLWVNLRSKLESASEMDLMLASSQMPRGVGDTKLGALFLLSTHPDRWQGLCEARGAPAGWSEEALKGFWGALGPYVAWRRRELSWIQYPILPGAAPAPASATAATPPACSAGTVCMTGFRDAALEARARAAGWIIADSLTSKVTVLLVPDGDVKESGKVKTAREKGIKIIQRSKFLV